MSPLDNISLPIYGNQDDGDDDDDNDDDDDDDGDDDERNVTAVGFRLVSH